MRALAPSWADAFFYGDRCLDVKEDRSPWKHTARFVRPSNEDSTWVWWLGRVGEP